MSAVPAADRPKPKPPPRRLTAVPVVPVEPEPKLDPQLSVGYWNHPCPECIGTVWVPNHRRVCAEHESLEGLS